MGIDGSGPNPPHAQVHLRLYGTLGCHLCDQAFAILYPLTQTHGWIVESVDVADDDALLERYGVRIPVLAKPGRGRELEWPFTLEQIHALVLNDMDEVP